MEFLGVGLPELFFIILIALVILGPKDMVKAGRTIGKWLRKVVTSDGWQMFQRTSREIRTLPNRLMREAGWEELQQTTGDMSKQLRGALNQNIGTIAPPGATPNLIPSQRRPVNENETRITLPETGPAEEPHEPTNP